MKLYYAPGTCALAVQIVLEWTGVDYESERVELGSAEFLKINPLGAVPAFTDGDERVMTQADSILKYIANKYPAKQLAPEHDIREIQQLDQWLAFLTGDFHPAFFPIFKPERFTLNHDQASLDAAKQAGFNLVVKVMRHIEAHLADRRYILGEKRTIADAYAFAIMRWTKKFPTPLSDYSGSQNFVSMMLEDEGVAAAMRKQGLK